MFQHTAGPEADANFKEHLGSKSAEELRAELDAIFEKEEMEGVPANPDVVAAYTAAMEELEPNIQAQPPGSFQESWATFTKDHPNLFPKEKPKSRNAGTRLRRFLEVAILAAVLLVASAAAFDWPDYVVTWGKEIFHIAPAIPTSGVMKLSEPNSDGYSTLADAAVGIGITDPASVSWIPTRYTIQTITGMETSDCSTVTAVHQSENSELVIRISSYPAKELMPDLIYEKNNDGTQQVYTKNGIDHYIIENYDRMQALWKSGTCMYTISGYLSTEEMEWMIDSIYGG